MNTIRLFIEICLLRAGPEDVPASSVLLKIVLFGYFLLGLVINQLDGDWQSAVLLTGTELVVMLSVVALLLQVRKLSDRYQQTVTAMAGSGIVFGLLALPLLAQFAGQQGELEASNGLLLLITLLMIWSLLVTAHIFRRALTIGPGSAVLLTLGYTLFMLLIAALVMSGVAG